MFFRHYATPPYATTLPLPLAMLLRCRYDVAAMRASADIAAAFAMRF